MGNAVDELAALFGHEPEPAIDLDAVDEQGNPLPGTTAWMDGIRTAEELAEQYMVYIQCAGCFEWTFVEGTHEMHTSVVGYSRGLTCENCGGSNFDPQSVTSKRTFNEARAKNRRPKGYRNRR